MKSQSSFLVLLGVLALSAGSARAVDDGGACCKPDDSCFFLTLDQCTSFDGVFHVGKTCAEVDCKPVTTTTVKPTTTTTTLPKKPEGCTPGYWKQDHHFDSWVDYSPGDSFEDVFGRDVAGDPTLLDALWQGGGGLKALMRHAVAALLNASSLEVDPVPAFDTPAEVIEAFQAAYDSGAYSTTKDMFERSNETGCPLN
jgi:hypothetical protein